MKTPYAPCPECGAENANKIGFTWWGGALGPMLLTHVKCWRCGTTFNGKTGKSNRNGIIIYTVVGVVVSVVVLSLLAANVFGDMRH